MNGWRSGLLLLICAATACSGESQPPSGTGCPLAPLPLLPLLPTSTLNYPASGSANVVDSANLIVVSGYVKAAFIYLRSSTGTAVVPLGNVPVPAPLPQPNIPITFPDVTALRIPQLAPATTYAVVNELSTTCANPVYGSFTTR